MRAGMILGSMGIILGGLILIATTAPIGVGDGVAITLVSIRLGMILGIMVVSTLVTGAAIGAVIGGITTIIQPITQNLCVIMPMVVQDSIIIIWLVAAVV